MKKSEAASNLIEYIDAQLLAGGYPVGGKLPSLRALAQKFKISYSTAKKGIDYLEAQGKLRKSPRSGIYVESPCAAAGRSGADGCRIAIITPGDSSFKEGAPGLFHTAIGEIRRLALENDFEVIAIPVPNVRVIDPAAVDQVNRCRGVIIMKELDQWINTVPFTIPTVGVLMENDYDGRISIVGIDPFNAARQAVDYFLSKGKTKVHIVEFEAPSYKNRARIFELFFREAGGVVTGKTVLRSGEKAEVEYYADDRGYLFTSDNLLFDCMKSHLAGTGENIIERYCILGIDGKSLLSPWNVSFPTIAADWKAIGGAAFRECLAAMTEKKHICRRIYLPGKLVARQPSR